MVKYIQALILLIMLLFPCHAVCQDIPEASIRFLIDDLKNPSYVIRLRAIERIADFGKPVVKPVSEALKTHPHKLVRQGAAEILGKIGSREAYEELIGALEDANSGVRWRAARALSHSNDYDAITPLIKSLKDENPEVRQVAAATLGDFSSEKATMPLIECLKDRNWRVRDEAALALARINDKRAVEPLIAALGDKNSNVCHSAIEALGEIGSRQAVEYLAVCLQDEVDYIRSAAAKVLGAIGNEEDEIAVSNLIEALNDHYYTVRNQANKALENITGQDFGIDYPRWADWYEKVKLKRNLEQFFSGKTAESGRKETAEVVKTDDKKAKIPAQPRQSGGWLLWVPVPVLAAILLLLLVIHRKRKAVT